MKNLKNERGAITLVVLVSMLFMVSFLMSAYMIVSNRAQKQSEISSEIQQMYSNDQDLNVLYNSYINNEIIPIYTVEQLLKIGTGEQLLINNKYCTMTWDSTYALMNDLEFDVSSKVVNDILGNDENGKPKNWIPINSNSSFKGYFEGNGYNIKVTNTSGEVEIYSSLMNYECTHLNYENGICTICGKKESIINADIIVATQDKTEYYGKTVNYTCGDPNVGWRIFYAGPTPGGTENNIYLIADKYVAWDDIGSVLRGLLEKNDTYTFTLSNSYIIDNPLYTGGTHSNRFINSPAKNWLKYARSTNIDNGYGFESTAAGMIKTAMMLDIVVWKNYCNTIYASYAIGGPTLDMFAASWNQTQNTRIEYSVSSDFPFGYNVNEEGSETGMSVLNLSESSLTGNLYLYDNDSTSDDYFFISSPIANRLGSLWAIHINGTSTNLGVSQAGLRPIVCLYSDIELTTDSTKKGNCDFGFITPCEHEFLNGTCTICARECTHSYTTEGICEICGIDCTHNYSNGECTICEKACEHNYVEGVCTICGKINCVHSYTDGVCTICGYECAHKWINTGKCEICQKACNHEYDANNVCTICGYSSCIAEGTLITLANGEQIAVEKLTGEEKLLVWNMQTGSYDAAEIAYIINHNNMIDNRKIIHAYFSDGTDIEIISDHGFYDLDLNKIIYINEENYEEYIGHWFVMQNLNTEKQWNNVQLTEIKIEYREVRAYEVVTFEHLTCFTNGLLSISSLLNPFCNIFEVNEASLSYDKEKMTKDIEKYGLFTYEDFKDLIPEYAFKLYHVDYLKVALGKGLTTWEEINFLVDYYHKEIAPLVNDTK